MVVEKAPAFQFYPKEFLSSSKVIAMTPAERGAYITLLSMQWLDGSLPTDLSVLARLVGLPTATFKRLWPANLARCFEEREGRLLNARLEDERKKQAAFRHRQSDAAASRWHKPSDAVASQRHTPKPSQPHALQSASASASAETRATPLSARRRLDAAFEGGRLYVPQRAHTDMVALRNRPTAETELFAFYARICEDWTHGAHRTDNPGADMFRFWKARYDAEWPPTIRPPVSAPSAAELEQRRNTTKYARSGP